MTQGTAKHLEHVDIGIVGYGNSGQAVAAWARQHGYSFKVFDDRIASDDSDPLSSAPRFKSVDPASDYAKRWIVSPGVAPSHKMISQLIDDQASIDTDVGLFMESFSGVAVGITGTNGKTTVTEMICHILTNLGARAEGLGNTGTSPLSASENLEYAVLELSSFQLWYTQEQEYAVAVCTNFSADHLDWHTDLEEYKAAKGKLIQQSRACILHERDRQVWAPFLADSQSSVHWIGKRSDPLEIPQWDLWGTHNQENAYMAVETAALLGFDRASAVHALESFEFGAHRVERVDSDDGRIWINDSKGTNVHAVKAAIRSASTPLILLLGGVYKGGDFAGELSSLLCGQTVIVYGRDRHMILNQFQGERTRDSILLLQATGLEKALELAEEKSNVGDTILLSPGCSSFDEFRNYGHRGDVFRKWVSERSAA